MKKMLSAMTCAGALIFTTASFAAGETYSVCETEYERTCPAHDSYAYCGTVKATAASLCQQSGSSSYTLVKLSGRGGTKCGVGMFRVICK
jgi:hypothetical protein